MEIHKPKPIHSWRELLSELGVVVLGIIIALSGERLLEYLRDRHHAKEARQNIHAEIAVNLAVLRNRNAIQPCIDRRLDEIGSLLNAGGEPGYEAPSWLGHPEIWEMVHAKWQVLSQAGRAPLLEADEQAAYGFIYALLQDILDDEGREQLAWGRLQVLEGFAHPSAGLRDSLRLELQDARTANADITGLDKTVERRAAQLGIVVGAADRRSVTGICFATNTPRAEALKRLQGVADTPAGGS
jgi:hypothetical protein